MSHYAKVRDGRVLEVIVAEEDFFTTFRDSSPGTWIQTSYRTRKNQHPEGRPLRGNFAGIGYIYDYTHDVFYGPQPYPSWILDQTTWTWKAPVDRPTDGQSYIWDEATKSWIGA